MVEFAIGMKIMVTENIEIDLDLTNGARGKIVDTVLHPDEPLIGDEPVVTPEVHVSIHTCQIVADKCNHVRS